MVLDPASIRDDTEIPHTSTRIEDAALELFYLRGFKTTTMREIALACGLTPGALYNHFPSKDDLLAKIMIDVHRDLDASIEEAVNKAGDDPRDQVRAYCYSHSLFHTRLQKHALVANREIGSLKDEARAEVEAIRRKSGGRLRDMLRRGSELGLFDVADERVVANLALTMAVSIATWFKPGAGLSGEQVAALDAELVLRMLGADGTKGDMR